MASTIRLLVYVGGVRAVSFHDEGFYYLDVWPDGRGRAEMRAKLLGISRVALDKKHEAERARGLVPNVPSCAQGTRYQSQVFAVKGQECVVALDDCIEYELEARGPIDAPLKLECGLYYIAPKAYLAASKMPVFSPATARNYFAKVETTKLSVPFARLPIAAGIAGTGPGIVECGLWTGALLSAMVGSSDTQPRAPELETGTESIPRTPFRIDTRFTADYDGTSIPQSLSMSLETHLGQSQPSRVLLGDAVSPCSTSIDMERLKAAGSLPPLARPVDGKRRKTMEAGLGSRELMRLNGTVLYCLSQQLEALARALKGQAKPDARGITLDTLEWETAGLREKLASLFDAGERSCTTFVRHYWGKLVRAFTSACGHHGSEPFAKSISAVLYQTALPAHIQLERLKVCETEIDAGLRSVREEMAERYKQLKVEDVKRTLVLLTQLRLWAGEVAQQAKDGELAQDARADIMTETYTAFSRWRAIHPKMSSDRRTSLKHPTVFSVEYPQNYTGPRLWETRGEHEDVLHLVVLQHGLGGTAKDLVAFKTLMTETVVRDSAIRLGVLAIRGNEGHTDDPIDVQAERLVQELRRWLEQQGEQPVVHFIAHSLGCLVVRAALPKLGDLRLGSCVLCCGPHLGAVSKGIVKSGISLIAALSKSQAMRELGLKEQTLFGLAEHPDALARCKRVILFSALGDGFVPCESALVLGTLRRPGTETDSAAPLRALPFIRVLARYPDKVHKELDSGLDSLTGRTLHVFPLADWEAAAILVRLLGAAD